MRIYILDCDICHTHHQDIHIGRTTIAIKSIPHTYVNQLPFSSVEAKGVCILTGNSGMVFIGIFKSLQKVCSDTDITELLGTKNKTILADDLNSEHPVWNINVSNTSCLQLLGVFQP